MIAPTGANLRTDHLLMADTALVANEQGHSVLELKCHRFSRDPLADIRRIIPQPGATCLAAGQEGDNLLVHQLCIAQIQFQISARFLSRLARESGSFRMRFCKACARFRIAKRDSSLEELG